MHSRPLCCTTSTHGRERLAKTEESGTTSSFRIRQHNPGNQKEATTVIGPSGQSCKRQGSGLLCYMPKQGSLWSQPHRAWMYASTPRLSFELPNTTQIEAMGRFLEVHGGKPPLQLPCLSMHSGDQQIRSSHHFCD